MADKGKPGDDPLLANVRASNVVLAFVLGGVAVFSIWYSSALGLPESPPNYAMGSFRFFELERSALMFAGLVILLMVVASAAGLVLPFKFSFSVAGAQVGVEQVAQTGADLAAKVEDNAAAVSSLRRDVRKVKAQGRVQAEQAHVVVSLAEKVTALQDRLKDADNPGGAAESE
jgi:hypothetical protein